MIHTSRQLKALVRNMSGGDSIKAQIIIRSYVMERFLERLSLSKYKENLILKGGMLIAAMVGLDQRSTMDIDATVKNLSLTEEDARQIVEEILSVPLEDGMSFTIKGISHIMDEADYPGIRLMLDAVLENMHTPLKIDFSAGDVITPREVSYSFRLLFEERAISVMAYNLETVLAEKIETVLSRGTANTRMRDFYDIYVLLATQGENVDLKILKSAYMNTSKKRGSSFILSDASLIINEVAENDEIITMWKNYQRKFHYATRLAWEDVLGAVKKLAEALK